MAVEPIEPDQERYLRDHRWALLVTTRRDGSPQVSMVAYHHDGVDVVVSCRRSSAKAVNVARDRRVVVTVVDDQRYLSVAGEAELIDSGEQLAALTARLQASLEPADAAVLQRDIDAGLEAVGRVVLRITPRRVVGRI